MADGEDRKAALVTQLAAQRAHLSRHSEAVRKSVDVAARAKASFAESPLKWIAASTFAGVLLTRLRRGKREPKKSAPAFSQPATRAAFLWPVAKMLFDLAKPALVSMLTARAASFVAGCTDPRRDRAR